MNALDFVGKDHQADSEILESIKGLNVNEGGLITNPGKFEFEEIYTPYFWTQCLDGFYDDQNSECYALKIDTEMAAKFPMLSESVNLWMGLDQNEQGFVTSWITKENPTEEYEG